ncbi:MAG: heme exporter protein CcmB [Porticoccaceae bacterium]|jgi:heme exporter protein B|nr:heme exporter protein CcmB [Porticoccaceae bacterium]MBT6780325.1 heme exporter protein CcmB [Porticoccaceae bacterium]MDG1243230.1 heme exporter protein CcmB [Porticoccaceae bacterium]MDG1324106.1 heme exporter protein CcmB [Porticoccaceae bacterium]MDG1782715.1 heme exporter protein CcmB [Porticoccaceae bacterium]|tara:strand:+ start:2964 stop:3644 length:681 start_codon:yes stop_codon:yes gene_type:complete
MPESNRGFSAYFRRDLLLAYRRRGEVASPVIFFVMVATLIPLGVTPEPDSLKEMAPGIIWVMALLATLLSAEGLFVSDYKDGSLEQLLISPNLLVMPIFGKVTAHWITTGLPLTLASPLIALMLSLPSVAYLPMMAGLALGTGCLSFLAAIGAALTVSLQKGSLLLTLIVMPLYMPVIIFGSAVVQYSIDGMAWSGPLAILGAMLTAAIALCPLAIAAVLRLTTIN